MALSTWWQGDPLPSLPALPTFHAERSTNVAWVAAVTATNEHTRDFTHR